jgi:uncharacterized metal-binding protein YceD (DUF177 family)
MALKFNIRHIEDDDLHLVGELGSEELDLGDRDPLIQVRTPVTYDLVVQQTGPNILAQGKLEATLHCECARCLKQFEHKVLLPDWAAMIPLEGEEKVTVENDLVDLTPYIREDILLSFPQHPLCSGDCAGLPERPQKVPAKQSPAWSELNKIKF